MNRSSSVSLSLLALACMALAPAAHAQVHFDFTFSAFPLGGNTGSGVLDLASDPGNGTFTYGSLMSPTYSFTVNGLTFTQANFASDPAKSEVRIFVNTNGRRNLVFTDTGGPAYGGGVHGGSLDLINGANTLSFSPSISPFTLASTGATSSYVATASAAPAVPEPGSVALLIGMGISGAGFLVRRRKNANKAA